MAQEVMTKETGTEKSLFSRILFPISGKDGETVNKSGAQVIALTYLGAGLVAGGMIGRKRAENGKAPIAKILF